MNQEPPKILSYAAAKSRPLGFWAGVGTGFGLIVLGVLAVALYDWKNATGTNTLMAPAKIIITGPNGTKSYDTAELRARRGAPAATMPNNPEAEAAPN